MKASIGRTMHCVLSFHFVTGTRERPSNLHSPPSSPTGKQMQVESSLHEVEAA